MSSLADGRPAENAADDGTSRFARGLAARKQVLGDAYVESALAAAPAFEANFQRMVTEYCWGECWADDTLPWTMRSALNLGMTAALGRMEEFELHFKGALRNGLSPQELVAILTQITVYCGVPAGVACFRIARQILGGLEDEGPETA
jgi:4-carboxymuconolactone decarboxylase